MFQNIADLNPHEKMVKNAYNQAIKVNIMKTKTNH